MYTAPPNAQYTDYAIQQYGKALFVPASTGADGSKRLNSNSLLPVPRKLYQGAHSGAWYKIGNDGLLPGVRSRFVFGKR